MWRCRLMVSLGWMVWAVACHNGPSAAEQRQMERDFVSLTERFPDADLTLGRQIYLRHCSVCHQADGTGTGAAIPPLAGHAPELLRAPGGRRYVAHLVLYGVSGRIKVGERTYFNMMPALAGVLTDDKLAAAFNYAAVSWGNQALLNGASLLREDEVAAARNVRVLPQNVLLLRPQALSAAPKP